MSGSPQCEHTWFLLRVVVSASVEPPIALSPKEWGRTRVIFHDAHFFARYSP